MFVFDFSLFFRNLCVWCYFCFVFACVISLKKKKCFFDYFYISSLGNTLMFCMIPSPKVLHFKLSGEKLLKFFLTQPMSAMTVLPCPSCIQAHSSTRSAHKRATKFFRLYIFAHVFRALAYWARKYTICYQVKKIRQSIYPNVLL